MGVWMHVEGMKEFNGKLKKKANMGQFRQVVNQYAEELKEEVKNQARGPFPNVVAFKKGYATGATMRSVRKRKLAGDMRYSVATNKPYNVYTEYGTAFMEPEPVLEPAERIVRPRFIRAMQNIMERD